MVNTLTLVLNTAPSILFSSSSMIIAINLWRQNTLKKRKKFLCEGRCRFSVSDRSTLSPDFFSFFNLFYLSSGHNYSWKSRQ